MRPTTEYMKLMKKMRPFTASAVKRNAQKKTSRVKRAPKKSKRAADWKTNKDW